VVVVAISSSVHIRRCLDAIQSQIDPDSCQIIVAADPRVDGIGELRAAFPSVVFLADPAAGTPLTLTAMALQIASGTRIVLTEDSCVASADWLAQLTSVDVREHAAVGGAVEVADDASSAMWAFAYVDFFRYMPPLQQGPARSLSVCNVAYSAEHLEAIRDHWIHGFHETNVHDALARRFGELFLVPGAVVRVNRHVAFGDAMYERFAFGRLFGATRVSDFSDLRRMWFALVSAGLPFLLLWRLGAKAFSDRKILARFSKAFPAVLALVLAWSWGEWLGYVTGRAPRSTKVAQEIPAPSSSS
jgi:hypothetical protein